MWPNNNGVLWKSFFEDRDESLEVFKDGLLVIPQPFST
jgi:hypothetical protein